MAAAPTSSAAPGSDALIDGRFAVDPAQPLAGAGGGLPAFAVVDRVGGRTGLMAVQVRPDAPPRPAAFGALPEGEEAAVLVPLAHGPARGLGGAAAWFVICPAPPGPPLWPDEQPAIKPWGEAELLQTVLRPAALALEALRLRGLTHRAIRPNNIFRAPGQIAVLGCAWASPPAALQPAAFEPPYMAMCLPAGRGEGSIADDVYALGVTLLALALGRLPWAGLAEEELIRRKLALGSYAALTQDTRLPAGLAELLRGMLAEEPEHRPPPSVLADPASARGRRVAVRPVRTAQRALEMRGGPIWDARSLAYAIARDPAGGARLLRMGVVEHWLRRGLDDASLAARIEELVRRRNAEGSVNEGYANALLVMRAIAVLDPLAPPCWDGLALWPDGLGPALAAAAAPEAESHDRAGDEAAPTPAMARQLADLIAAEIWADWQALRGEDEAALALRAAVRRQRTLLLRSGWAEGMARLRYELNPLLPCRSPVLGGRLVVRIGEVLPALEAALQEAKPRSGVVLDREMVAFIAARQPNGLEAELAPLADGMPPERAVMAQLRLLAALQVKLRAGLLPALAAALAESAKPALDSWRSRTRRAAKETALAKAAATGDLAALVAVLDDRAAREADAAGLRQAMAQAARIDAELAALAEGAPARAGQARAFGRDIAAALAMAALAATGVAALLE
jgi:hypothetical protein